LEALVAADGGLALGGGFLSTVVLGFLLLGGSFLLGVFLVGLPLMLIASPPSASTEARVMILGPGLLAVIVCVVWILRSWYRLRGSHKRDLNEGQAEVLHCTAEDAVLLEEYEDEGLGYFVDLGDQTILFLQGQQFYDLAWGENRVDRELDEEDDLERERHGAFPNREFRIVRTPHSELDLAFECVGERFSPSRRLDPETFGAPVPRHGTVFSGALPTLEDDLRQLARSKR